LTVIITFSIGQHDFGIRLDQCQSVGEILHAVAEKAKTLAPGELIVSNAGSDATLLEEGRTPTLHELDAVAPDHPVLLTFEDGRHVNSRMMERANITRETPCPPKGAIGRDPVSGKLNGVFAGSAVSLLTPKGGSTATGEAGNFSTDQLYEAFKWGQPLLASTGVTGYRNPSLSPAEMLVYQRLWENDELTVRVAMDVHVEHVRLSTAEFIEELGHWGVRQPYGDEWLRLSGVSELWIDHSTDGMLNSWAYQKVPPAGEGQKEYFGIQRISLEKLSELHVGMNRLGWRPLLHAGGDIACDIALDAFEAADSVASIGGKRWVLDHAHYGQPRHIARVLQLQAIVGMQYHAYMYYPVFAEFHGADKAANLFPARSWIDAGITVAGGSDYSQVPVNLFDGIYFFITRQTKKWGPIGEEHAVTREQALRMYTINCAYQTFEEHLKGSLEIGKLADLLILNDDFLRCDPEALRYLHPLCTIVGGQVVYQHDSYRAEFPEKLRHKERQ